MGVILILGLCGLYILSYISEVVFHYEDIESDIVPATICFLIAVGGIFYYFVKIKKDMNKNREKFEKADKIAEENINKKPNELSLKKDIPVIRIRKIHPDFSEVDFYSSIKGIIDDFFITLNADNLDKLDYFCTQDFVENKKYKLINEKELFVNYLFGRRKIEIVDYNEDADEITLKTNYKQKSISVNPKTGEVISGLTRFIEKTVYLGVVESQRHSQDAVHCPNCGALLDYYLAKKCNYCNNELTFNRTWIINNIEESHFNE